MLSIHEFMVLLRRALGVDLIAGRIFFFFGIESYDLTVSSQTQFDVMEFPPWL